MAKFFVGQMARVVRTYGSSVPVGTEVRIVKVGRSRGQISPGIFLDAECIVDIPSIGPPPKPHPYWVALFDQLEPIVPEGAAPSAYSYREMMDKLREGERA